MSNEDNSSQKPILGNNSASGVKMDKELEEFRNAMTPPSTFEDGFTWTAFFGAIFVALLMIPAGMYMNLLVGQDPANSAARWVTAILFIEVARRTNKVLKNAEIYVLFALVGAAMALPFEGILWKQFFVQSRAVVAQGIADYIPNWYAPTDPDLLAQRNIFDRRWIPAMLLVVFGMVVGRLDHAILGFGLFKLTSDIERLPFPMAPLGAQGILALSEEQEEERTAGHDLNSEENADNRPSSWRWRVFSIGGAMGLVFAIFYIGIPSISGALLQQPIVIFPIPFVDWTQKTQGFLPAVATGFCFDLGQFVLGMMLPFFAMVGAFIGLIITVVANPILYNIGLLSAWNPGDGTVVTIYKNSIDFYLSFGIGLSLAIAVAGFIKVYKALKEHKASGPQVRKIPLSVTEGRGDIKFKWVIAVYIVSTLLYIFVSGWLINWHRGVMIVMIFYGFLYTPIISYVTARLEGIAGQVIDIPMVREVSFILSGYRGVAVWFLPVPMHNYGVATVGYRTAELTGTKFWSLWKTTIIFTPIVIATSLFFTNFIWSLGPIPSERYPFAQKMWEFNAAQQAVVLTATMGGYSIFEQAIRFPIIFLGFGLGSVAFGVLSWFACPTFLVYGVVRGLGQTLPHTLVTQFIGALVGQFYFKRKFGLHWRQYIPVVVAGWGCGYGLIGMLGIGVTFLAKSVFQIPF